MEEQNAAQAQSNSFKPFKGAEFARPDIIVESQNQFGLSITSQALPKPGMPRLDSSSNIAQPVSKVPSIISKSVKKPMTPRRFVAFVCGLFLAGLAGSLSNVLFTSVNEKAFPPQYVKDFHQAQALPDQRQSFNGMSVALAQGEKIEPLSRRFAELTATLARHLDKSDRFIEAKTQWARAALPSEVASPELRERKRAYLIAEAESEHRAFLSKKSKSLDLALLNKVEEAADIFQKSEVTFHGPRAVKAFIAAGALAADNNEFERASKDFDLAEMIANSQWQDGGTVQADLDAARRQAELQQTQAK
ncbi:unnamed protein product [Sphagnum balticum]